MISIDVRATLDDFDLQVSLELEAPVTALFGPSGVGKTSLLEIVAGLRAPDAGEIRLGDDVLFSSADAVSLPPEKRRIGYVPQDALLFPHLSVLGNLRYGMGRGTGSLSIESVTEALGIEPLLNRSPERLSGGERQRVALGRALLSGPRLLLLDEPLAALDAGLKGRILPYLRRVRDRYRIPAVVVSHDVSEVLTLCDEVVVLEHGRVTGRGDPRKTLTEPRAGGAWLRTRFENVLDVRVVDNEPEEGMTRVETEGGVTLAIPYRDDPLGAATLVGILADDILLARTPPEGLSARNVVAGTVEAIDESGGVAMVKVATPDPLYVKLTHRAIAQLGIAIDVPVHLIVKTHSIHRLE